MLFSRGCGLYLRAPGFDKTISYLEGKPERATAEDGRMMAGKLNPPNVMIIEKKPHVGGDFGFTYMYMAVMYFLGFVVV